jgi:membrane associated rhomboid family serine protease
MEYFRYISIIGIISLCAIVFVGEQVSDSPFRQDWGATPTHIRAAYEQFSAGEFSIDGARELSTLITSIFLHGGVEHILYNMVFLWTFGILGCQLLGQWRTLIVYLLCGIGGGITHTLLELDSPAPMVGASGAISGLVGLYVGLALRWQLPNADVWPLAYPVPPMQLVAFGAIGFIGDMLLMMRRDQHIAYGAHLGGLFTGILIAAVVTTIYPTMNTYNRRNS